MKKRELSEIGNPYEIQASSDVNITDQNGGAKKVQCGSDRNRKLKGICCVCVQFEIRMPQFHMTEEYLMSLLRFYEGIKRVKLEHSEIDKVTRLTQGFAFVSFDSSMAGVNAALLLSKTIDSVSLKDTVMFTGHAVISDQSFILHKNDKIFAFNTSSDDILQVPKAQLGTSSSSPFSSIGASSADCEAPSTVDEEYPDCLTF